MNATSGYPEKINAVTLDQPWPSLIAAQAKLIETRSWAPHKAAIGQPLAIHAGKSRNFLGTPYYPEFNQAVARHLGDTWYRNVPLGAVVAVAILHDAVQIQSDTKLPEGDELIFGHYETGRWMWILSDVRAIDPPVAARGYQRLWKWTPPPEVRSILPTADQPPMERSLW